MHQGNSQVDDLHQGGWVMSPDGRYQPIYSQDVTELDRIIHLQLMYFLNDWPFIGRDQNGDGIGESVEKWSVPAERMSEYAIRQPDDFAEKVLGLQRQWQVNPNIDLYSLGEHPGYLRLYCYWNPGGENLLRYVSNVLTQTPQKQKLLMIMKLSLLGGENDDLDEIGMVGYDYECVGLYCTGKGIQVRCYRGTVMDPMSKGEAGERLVFSREAGEERAWFRLVLEEDRTYGFSYSPDGRNLTRIEYSFPLERATWTGAKLCLQSCSRENRESEGYCDYEYAEIK